MMTSFTLDEENLSSIKISMFNLVKNGFSYSELYDMEINDFRFFIKQLIKMYKDQSNQKQDWQEIKKIVE